MRESPEYELKSRALQNQANQSAEQMDLAREQWELQKKAYNDRFAAAEQGSSALSGLVNQYNTAYGEARASNERRYQGMLGIADQTTGQRQADIRQDYLGQQSDMMQQLSRLGMGNTTIGANLGTGIQRGMQESLNRSADTAQQTRLGIMERRTDEYPSNEIILALAQQLGQSGGGGMGGMFGAMGQMTQGGSGLSPAGPGAPGGGGPRPVGPRPPG